ncbi:two-component system sensor histidine kinase NtrB [Desulfocurvus sp. DL9XJH121]
MIPDNADGFCLWELDDQEFVVGIVGSGPGFWSLSEILSDESYSVFLPPMRLSAVAEPDLNTGKVERLKAEGVRVFASWRAMLAEVPELNLAVDIKGVFDSQAARRDVPQGVSIMDRRGAVFLCGLHTMHQAAMHQRMKLDRSRALLKAVAGQIREDVLLLDLKSRVVDMNEHVQQRTGQDKEHLVGKPCWQVQSLARGVPFCRGENLKCPFHATLAQGRKAEALLTRVSPEGKLLYFRIYSYPIRDAEGNMTHVAVLRRDITSRTSLEKQRQQSEKLSVVGEMAMYLAHEIRNPLFAIGGFVGSLLKSPNLDETDKEKAQIILEETKRLDKMLSDVLNFTKPTQGSVGEVDLPPLMEQVAGLMRIGYERSGYGFVIQCASDLPKVIAGPGRIKQCLVNCVKNALEAMPEGGTVTMGAVLDGDMVALSVRDTGRGMTPQEMEKAFSPFASTKEGGTGLGLAMIQKIIEDFGGSVHLESRPGEGTTITMRLMPTLSVEWSPSPIPEIVDDDVPDSAPGFGPEDEL